MLNGGIRVGPRTFFLTLMLFIFGAGSASASIPFSQSFCGAHSGAHRNPVNANLCDVAYKEHLSLYFEASTSGYKYPGGQIGGPAAATDNDQKIVSATMRVSGIPFTGIVPLTATLIAGLIFAFSIRRKEND